MKALAPLRRALLAFQGKAFPLETTVADGGWTRLYETTPGGWQRRLTVARDDVLSLPTAFAAQGLIAQDVAKLGAAVRRWNPRSEIWERSALDWVDDLLARPNAYQNRLQFVESWIHSKLSTGNTYALKARRNDGRVAAMHVLHPGKVTPLVAGGSVFYRLQPDNLAGIEAQTVPASEIIHDRFNTLYHPLVGVSPLHPAALAALQGIEIQQRAARFWRNNAQPSGALVVPETTTIEEARAFKKLWQAEYGGDNTGSIAVLAGGLDYKPLAQTAKDSQQVEQLKLTREEIATAYRIPLYKLNAAPAPSVANTGQLDQEYYSNCLQIHVAHFEIAMTLGLELPTGYRVDLDEGDILRMDPLTKAQVLREKVESGQLTRNEARRLENMPPLPGGDVLLIQEQYWPASAVADPGRGLPKKDGGPSTVDATPAKAAEDLTGRALEAFARMVQ